MKNIIGIIIILTIAAVFRFAYLGSTPPSLYWDEVSQAYNSYSILTTGRDEHGEFMPLARFKAFGDYKAPVYIYLTVPFMALFGVNEFATRFPSAFFGSLTVLSTYFLMLQLFLTDKNRRLYALAAAGILAVSPWHIQLSRAAYEANIATFFTVSGVMFFFFAKKKRPWFFILSSICLVLGFYAFNAHRIFIPLITFLLIGIYYKDLLKNRKQTLFAGVLGILLLIPFILFLSTPESRLRFNEVNIFTDLNVVKESNERLQNSGNSIFSKLIDNRRVIFAQEYIKHYFDFFSPKYLFVSGDENPRFSLQDNGILYIWELPLLLVGFYTLARRKDKVSLLICTWFLIAPLGAATARETPHALRALTYIPTYQMIGGLGLISIFIFLKQLKLRWFYPLSIVIFSLIVLFTISLFIHNYFNHFPKTYASQWQYGYKEAIIQTENLKNKYDKIVITDRYGRPYIYTLFYGGINPEDFWLTGNVKKDRFGFYNVYGIGSYQFVESAKIRNIPGKNTLFVVAPGEIDGKMKVIKTINFPSGKIAFIIGEKLPKKSNIK